MANKYTKRCSTSYVIREIQVKTTRYYYTPNRMTKIKNIDKCLVLMRMFRATGTLILLVKLQNGTATLEDRLVVSYKATQS